MVIVISEIESYNLTDSLSDILQRKNYIYIEDIDVAIDNAYEEEIREKYQNQATKLIDDFVVYLNTQKEAYKINRALKDVQQGKTNNILKLIENL